jgi:hypothetical protein
MYAGPGGGGRGGAVASNKNKVCMLRSRRYALAAFYHQGRSCRYPSDTTLRRSYGQYSLRGKNIKKAHSSNNPKKGVEIPIEKSVITYQSTRCHIPQEWNLCDSHEFPREILRPIDSRNPIIPECGSFRLKWVLTGFKRRVWNVSKIPIVTKFMDLKME